MVLLHFILDPRDIVIDMLSFHEYILAAFIKDIVSYHTCVKSKIVGKDQELIQSSTIPDQGYHKGK